MSFLNGDRSRANRLRRQKLARREAIAALRAKAAKQTEKKSK